MKFCNGCDSTLNFHFFNKDKSKYDGLCSYCKNCAKERKIGKRWTRQHKISTFDSVAYNLRRNYGLSKSDYQGMMEEQNNVCAICFNEAFKLFVDHNHATGKIRGLLCPNCNTGLGMFKDNTVIIEAALFYLDRRV